MTHRWLVAELRFTRRQSAFGVSPCYHHGLLPFLKKPVVSNRESLKGFECGSEEGQPWSDPCGVEERLRTGVRARLGAERPPQPPQHQG